MNKNTKHFTPAYFFRTRYRYIYQLISDTTTKKNCSKRRTITLNWANFGARCKWYDLFTLREPATFLKIRPGEIKPRKPPRIVWTTMTLLLFLPNVHYMQKDRCIGNLSDLNLQSWDPCHKYVDVNRKKNPQKRLKSPGNSCTYTSLRFDMLLKWILSFKSQDL